MRNVKLPHTLLLALTFMTAAATTAFAVDHSEFFDKPFKGGPEVTAKCLECHGDAATEVMKSSHWTWSAPQEIDGKQVNRGKANAINNFCVSVNANWPRCTSCHIGYGWKDDKFDLTSEQNVDCLVCHETTGTYKKFPAGAGHPVYEEKEFPPGSGKKWVPPDLVKVAQSVGKTSRKNCGVCHFFGGGGDAVKHGDQDSTLFNPDRDLDVHMDAKGLNFDCVRCHTTKSHAIAGRCYKHPADTTGKTLIQDDQIARISCISCHTETPHKTNAKLNDHTDKVACQSCHIPAFARKQATKMYWDWSTAGKKKDGKPYAEKGPYDKPVYDTKKGNFVWEMNVKPEYHWFNGSLDYILVTDKIDPSKPVQINKPMGSRDDPKARIYPFKNHRGKTPYDKVNKTMLVPHLFPYNKDDTTAYWKGYDWNKAGAEGMKAMGLPFGGEVGFVDTEYFYQTTHMVAPKEKAVACGECHSRQGRLANLAGFYMPGRDRSGILDIIGWVLVLGAMVGVTAHGVMRKIAANKRG